MRFNVEIKLEENVVEKLPGQEKQHKIFKELVNSQANLSSSQANIKTNISSRVQQSHEF